MIYTGKFSACSEYEQNEQTCQGESTSLKLHPERALEANSVSMNEENFLEKQTHKLIAEVEKLRGSSILPASGYPGKRVARPERVWNRCETSMDPAAALE